MTRPRQAENPSSSQDLDARFLRWANVIGLDARTAADVISLTSIPRKAAPADGKVISLSAERTPLRKAA
ncbi:MAG: hypothetical protein ACYTFO_00125 [Planctomycetota bacterium]|jgi:hypothetical protein